jgi:hypothetical protein
MYWLKPLYWLASLGCCFIIPISARATERLGERGLGKNSPQSPKWTQAPEFIHQEKTASDTVGEAVLKERAVANLRSPGSGIYALRTCCGNNTATNRDIHFQGPSLIYRNSQSPSPSSQPPVPSTNSDSQTPLPTSTPAIEAPKEFAVFPVGLNVGRRNVIQGILVRGKEDGLQAINFENWLVPYDAVIQALKLDIKPLPDGQLEVRAPGLTTRINPTQLRNDPELGLVFSIQDLQTFFGVPAEFDINEYTIVLNPPWLGQKSSLSAPIEVPVQLEGLPRVEASRATLTAIEQRVKVTGQQASSSSSQGELAAVGTFQGGSWYVRVNQADLADSRKWNLATAQYLRQTDSADYVVGSQPTFWRSQNSDEYWGITTIQRRGFVPPVAFGGGGFIPAERLQSSQVGRTIEGRAEPGTLVRLTEGFGDRVLAEVLVDSSGIYRFEDILVGRQFLTGNYRVLLYPQGRLSESPVIRDATFSTVLGQIPAGASATVISGGFRRPSSDSENENFMGKLTDFRGGIDQRWGVSESLTVGVGGVYDKTTRGLGELFFRPTTVPLEVAASVLSPDEKGIWDVEADIRYDPTSSISARFNSDRFSERLNLDWRVFSGFTLLGIYDSKDSAAVGVQTLLSGRRSFTFARATFDAQNRFRWNLTQRLGFLEFTQQGNEIGSRSELDYNLSGSSLLDIGHALVLNYETRNEDRTSNLRGSNLVTFGWRYRSQERSPDGNYIWEAQLGYGIGSRGSGVVATLQTGVVPGLLLRGRYEGASVTSTEPTYSLELVTSVNLQRGISPGDRQSDRFQTQGGLQIQTFFDRNNNGRRDTGEDFYTESANLLLILNNQPLRSSRPEVQTDRVLVRLPPGTYRLDIDPAGFPVDWQAAVDAYAVDVVAGSYTSVLVPLTQSYTRSGIVTDAAGNPVAGARVEAIPTASLPNGSNSLQRRFSVTNSAGVYYLEQLQQGSYNLQINGKSAQPNILTLDESSQPFQELNLQKP